MKSFSKNLTGGPVTWKKWEMWLMCDSSCRAAAQVSLREETCGSQVCTHTQPWPLPDSILKGKIPTGLLKMLVQLLRVWF